MAASAIAPVPASAGASDWSGLYAGLNGTDAIGRTLIVRQAGYEHASGTGWVLGGQAGFQQQFGDAVIGAETDFDFTGISGHRDERACPASVCGADIYEHDRFHLNDFGTLRARAGWAAGDLLPFVTAGYAYAVAGVTATFGGAMPSVFGHIRAHGWVAGAGLDYRTSDETALRIEYDHAELSHCNTNLHANLIRIAFVLDLVR